MKIVIFSAVLFLSTIAVITASPEDEKLIGLIEDISKFSEEASLRADEATDYSRRAYFSTDLDDAQDWARDAMQSAERARFAADAAATAAS